MKPQRVHRCLILYSSFILSLSACGGAGPEAELPPLEGESTQSQQDANLAEETITDVEDIQIQSLNTFRNIFNEWVVCGYLENIGSSTVGNIRIEVEFLDDAGATISELVTYEAPHGIEPGEQIPFHVFSMETLPELVDTRATITSLQPIDRNPAPVLIQGATIRRFQSGYLQIVGEVVNPNETAILIPEIQAAITSAEGGLLAADECDICTRYLQPAEVGPFRIVMYGLPAEVTASNNFDIYAFAEVSPTLEEFDLDWSTDQVMFLDPFNWLHMVGELENRGDQPINLHLLGTLYGTDGNVLDVAARELIPHAIPPGERTGYELKFWGPQATIEEIEQATNWKVQVDRYHSQITGLTTIELTASDIGVAYGAGNADFTGKIVNDSGTSVSISTVLLLLRDRTTNQIVGMGGMDYIGLIPEAGVDFLVSAFFPSRMSQADLDYTLQVMGY